MTLSPQSMQQLEDQLKQTDDLNYLMESAYERLHMLAKRERGKLPAGETMRTTALVNEAYIRLEKFVSNHALDRQRFYGLCATIMRRIVIDAARKRRDFTEHADKHSAQVDNTQQSLMILDMDKALSQFSKLNPRAAQVVECRFFAGYSNHEIADILSVSEKTVRRDWLLAKAYLLANMQHPSKP